MPRISQPGPRQKFLSAVAAVLATGLAVSACSDDPNAHNEADIVYASHLISHHAQTLQILDLSVGRDELTSKAGALADRTRTMRWDEVAAARKWLKTWGERIPKTALEHTHSDEPPEYDTAIPGVVTHEQMLRLQKSKPKSFLRDWLDTLIRHEEGAAELAAKAAASAENEDLAEFARKDERSHQQQVKQLKALLA